MNANLQQARRFGVAAGICICVALAAGLVGHLSGEPAPDHRVQLPRAFYPMYLALFLAILLAGVTVCLLIAGLIERFLQRGPEIAEPGASPNGGPAKRSGNSSASEGPPSVS
jgi:hypothetical protein